jgi:hypothetical protein
MQPFGELIVGLAGLVPERAGSPGEGILLRVGGLDLTLPVESRIGEGGELFASMPRGRMATGFDPKLSTLSVRFEVVS